MKKDKEKKPLRKSPLKIILIILLVIVGLIAAIMLIEVISQIAYDIKEANRLAKYESFDIIACMDIDSIQSDGDITYFNAVLEDGTIVRFEGKGVNVSEGAIELTPNSSIISLDAVGAIVAYNVHVSENTTEENSLCVAGGYTFSSATAVSSSDELLTFMTDASSVPAYIGEQEGGFEFLMEVLRPNFVCVFSDGFSTDSYTLDSIKVYYDADKKTTGVKDITLHTDFYRGYLEGYKYDSSLETKADLATGQYAFYLIVTPDTPDATPEDRKSVWFVESELYTVGDLKDADGNVLDKSNAQVHKGTTLEVTVGDYTVDVEIPIMESYSGAQVMHDLVPYVYPEATGELKTLVVPVCWADQTHMATEENLELYRYYIGRVSDLSGNEHDYTDYSDDEFALTEYFDIASYGKLDLTAAMTDWYYSDRTYAEMQDTPVASAFANEIFDWVKSNYPDVDWSEFDRDANGFVDSMIVINVGEMIGDSIMMDGYGYAVNHFNSYNGELAGSQENPTVNNFTSINHSFFETEGAGSLIHEFSHNLGLIDYYDVSYSGIDAVGSYDMQSAGAGDWNAYSKYAVGWVEPEIVTDLESGQSVEIEIGSMAETGDVIVIPAAGSEFNNSPFNEYIMIDLFTDDGVNKYDAAEYNLDGSCGVRIYHVNANMEKNVEVGESGKEYEIGTVHFANAYNKEGYYNIELIQSGKTNTFTDYGTEEDNTVTKKDFFYAGDVFTAEDYDEFFLDGKMDNGADFGYEIEIVSINDGTAVIRVTAQ